MQRTRPRAGGLAGWLVHAYQHMLAAADVAPHESNVFDVMMTALVHDPRDATRQAVPAATRSTRSSVRWRQAMRSAIEISVRSCLAAKARSSGRRAIAPSS